MYHKIKEAPTGITAMKVDGKFSESDFESIKSALQQDLKKYGRIRMYVEIHEFGGFEIAGFWEKIKIGLDLGSDFHKAAYLVEIKWLERLASMADFVTPFDLRTFHIDERDRAFDWLMRDRIAPNPN